MVSVGRDIDSVDDDIELATEGVAGGEKEGAMIPAEGMRIKGE